MSAQAANYDVAVIGAGIIGAACACALRQSRPGRRIAVVDSREPGAGTTAAAAGLVSLLTKQADVHMPAAAESIRLHEEWRARLNYEPGHRNGLLLVFEAREDDEAAKPLLESVRRFEPWLTRVSPEDVWTLEPNYMGKRFGGLHSTEAFRIDPVELTRRWMTALDPVSATLAPAPPGPDRLLLTTAVSRLAPAGDRWTIETSAGAITAVRVVVAAGADTPGLLSPLGWHLPIRSRRGQIARTKPLPGYVTRSIIGSSYLSSKFDESPPEGESEGRVEYSFATVVDERSRLWIGSTRRFSDDGSIRADERVRLLHEATQRLSGFQIDWIDAEFAGRRPWTPDGLPLIGRLPELENVYIAAGHEGDGVTLAPLTGELIAGMIDGRAPAIDPGPLRPDRFGRVWMPADSQSDTL